MQYAHWASADLKRVCASYVVTKGEEVPIAYTFTLASPHNYVAARQGLKFDEGEFRASWVGKVHCPAISHLCGAQKPFACRGVSWYDNAPHHILLSMFVKLDDASISGAFWEWLKIIRTCEELC